MRNKKQNRYSMLAAVEHILAQRVDFWPLSDRSIHYALLSDPPLGHAPKPDSVYANDRASYHDLTDLLPRACRNGAAHRLGEAESVWSGWLDAVLISQPSSSAAASKPGISEARG